MKSIKLTYEKQGWNPILGYFCTIICGLVQSLTHCSTRFPMTLDDYFDEKHRPNVVGISFERYIIFFHCEDIFNLNHDLIQLLCLYWFEVEVQDAKNRLTERCS